MTIALPTHLTDVVSAAAATSKEIAGNLLHEASKAAEHAAGATSTKGRDLLRLARPARSAARRRTSKRAVVLVAAGLVMAALAAVRRIRSSSRGVSLEQDGTPSPSPHEGNGRTTPLNSDEVKGRVKEAAGALTGDDDLKSDGERDQAAAAAKRAVDKVTDGIDAVKETFSNN